MHKNCVCVWVWGAALKCGCSAVYLYVLRAVCVRVCALALVCPCGMSKSAVLHTHTHPHLHSVGRLLECLTCCCCCWFQLVCHPFGCRLQSFFASRLFLVSKVLPPNRARRVRHSQTHTLAHVRANTPHLQLEKVSARHCHCHWVGAPFYFCNFLLYLHDFTSSFAFCFKPTFSICLHSANK